MKRRREKDKEAEGERARKQRITVFDMSVFSNRRLTPCPNVFFEPMKSLAETLLERLCDENAERSWSLKDLSTFLDCLDRSWSATKSARRTKKVDKQCFVERQCFVARCMDALWPLFETAIDKHNPQTGFDFFVTTVVRITTSIGYWNAPGTGRRMENIWDIARHGLSMRPVDTRGYLCPSISMIECVPFLRECRRLFFHHKNKERAEQVLKYFSRSETNDLDWLYEQYVQDPAFVSSLRFPRFRKATLNARDLVLHSGVVVREKDRRKRHDRGVRVSAESGAFAGFLSLFSAKRLDLWVLSEEEEYAFLNEDGTVVELSEMLPCRILTGLPSGLDLREITVASLVRLPCIDALEGVMLSLLRFPSLKKVDIRGVWAGDDPNAPSAEEARLRVQEIMHKFALQRHGAECPSVVIGGDLSLDKKLRGVMPCPLR